MGILVGSEGMVWIEEVREGLCLRCLSSKELEPPAADMARSAFTAVAGGQKERPGRSHDTRVYYFI